MAKLKLLQSVVGSSPDGQAKKWKEGAVVDEKEFPAFWVRSQRARAASGGKAVFEEAK